ncbi:MAG: rhomboid family intramembrane serine protease [Gemmataceae bacterium]
MRRLATLPPDQAQRLADYLLTQGIETRLDPDLQAPTPQCEVWVCDENRLGQAREELEQFQRDPGAPRYQQARRQAQLLRAAHDRAEHSYREQTTARREQILRLGTLPPTLLTWTLVTLCVFLFGLMLSNEQHQQQIIQLFVIDSNRPRPWLDQPNAPERPPYRPVLPSSRDHAEADTDPNDRLDGLNGLELPQARQRVVWVPLAYLPDVRGGQWWRLITPIFLHFSATHLLFNMIALVYLGGALESRYGTGRFLLLVLALALVSNLAQYFLGRGAVWENGHLHWLTSTQFGGMSGVVYGLFGFLWYKTRYRPESQLHLPSSVIVISVAWFLLCWTGAMGPIANVAHTAGLALGWLLGIWPDRTP